MTNFTFKKSIFAVIALVLWILGYSKIAFIFSSPESVLALSIKLLIDLIMFLVLLLTSCLFFTLFHTFISKWLPVAALGVIAAVMAMFLTPLPTALVILVAVPASLAVNFLMTQNAVNSYVNFQPVNIFSPSVKTLARVLLLSISIAYLLNTSFYIRQHGFKIPDSLIETSLELIPQSQFFNKSLNLGGIEYDPADIEKLKNDPELMQQLGISPTLLDQFTQSSQTTAAPFKEIVRSQFQTTVNKFITFIPMFMAVLLFFTMDWMLSILFLLIPLLIWVIYQGLKISGFITITTGTQEVKKMII